MKKILILFHLVMLSSLNYAQSPDSINLQLQFFPIIYENSSDVLIQFQKNNETENYNFSFSVENITNPVLNVGNINYATNNYLASGLIPETSYFLHIYVDDEFGNQIETVQSPIEFRTKNEGMINVSSTLFNELSEWSANENQTINFQDFLASLVNSISEYEIIYFIQRYFYKDTRLNTPWIPGGDIGEFPIDPRTKPEGDPPFPPEDECLCNFVINKSALAIPNTGADCNYSPKIDKDHGTDPEKWWWFTSKIGASHYAQFWQDGKNDEDPHHSKGTVENADSGFSPEFLGLNWLYLCQNYSTNLPAECECEKEVILNWAYNTRLTANAPDQIFLWNDGSHAVAQDYALLVETDSKGDFDVLGGGRAIVSTTCNTNFNPKFLRSISSLVQSIGVASQGVSAATIADVINSLADVIETDFIVKTGDCKTMDRSTSLTNGFETITLEPNVAKKVRLYSFFDVGVGGYGKWKPNARVLSDCYLDSVILPSNDDDPEACCTDKHASWTIGHMPGSPTTINNLKENVGADIGLYGPWSNYPGLGCCNPTVGCDWDCIIEPNLKCGDNDDGQGDFSSPETQYRTINDNLDFSIYPNPTAGILNINFTSKFVEMGRIEIFTISGKSIAVLYDGEFQKNNKLVLNLPNTISSGQYIVKINSENINHVSNLIISK